MNKLTITITGPAKSGKSNLAYCLKELLENKGISAEVKDDTPQSAYSRERGSWVAENVAVLIQTNQVTKKEAVTA